MFANISAYTVYHYLTFCIGECIGKAKIKLPYSKIVEYGISLEGLPEDVVLKHPSSYGKATMRKILANKDLYHMTSKDDDMLT